ncbi:MAG TPA: hypothetical protein VKT27_12275 [Candidatus Binataceae bacterium]|nr:hypothetical protein [Candidatus Binataceae bacterium]
MGQAGIVRFGAGLLAGAILVVASGCSYIKVSTAGWGPAPARASAPAPVSAGPGVPRFVQTTGMGTVKKQEEAKAPSWIRVQDCAIVAISSPARYACPDGKVYTANQLYDGRSGG